MSRDKRQKREPHALDADGNVLCNPRDREAAHRSEMEGIATENLAAVTCKNCLALLHKPKKRIENRQRRMESSALHRKEKETSTDNLRKTQVFFYLCLNQKG